MQSNSTGISLHLLYVCHEHPLSTYDDKMSSFIMNGDTPVLKPNPRSPGVGPDRAGRHWRSLTIAVALSYYCRLPTQERTDFSNEISGLIRGLPESPRNYSFLVSPLFFVITSLLEL